MKKGNYPAYTAFLLDEIGEEKLKNLIKKGQEVRKFTADELQQLIDSYKWKIETFNSQDKV